jgi:hypothetical protein
MAMPIWLRRLPYLKESYLQKGVRMKPGKRIETSDGLDDLERSLDERRKYFSPDWFRKLLKAELSLGDTFWIGNFGILLFVVPLQVLVLIMLLGSDVGAGFVRGWQIFFWTVNALYFLALARAVFITARSTPEVGKWRWVGVTYTALAGLITTLVSLSYIGVL